MTCDRGAVRAWAVVAAFGLAAACGDSATAPVPEPPRPSVVTVTPDMAALVRLGEIFGLSAQVRDQYGGLLTSVPVAWSSSDAGVASVDGSGQVTAVGSGTATITAAAGGARGTAEVTVTGPEGLALIALFDRTAGPGWSNGENWVTGAPLGEWHGVHTDADGRVVRVDLAGNGLSGEIPPELARLPALEVLDLGSNEISGEIPPEFGGLVALEELYLNENELSGELPSDLGRLGRLRLLDLGGNILSGPVPAELGRIAALEELYLNDNALSGPIPPELGRLGRLRELWLSSNGLSGAIPPEFGELLSLEILILRGNALSGPIPAEFSALEGLRWLWLDSNELSGPLRRELGELLALETLTLEGNALSGPIPPELGGLTGLRWLHLGRNELTGPVPQTLLELDGLTSLTLEGNPGLCIPGTGAFSRWLRGIQTASWGAYCNGEDRAVLERFHAAAGGQSWTNAGGWGETPALDEWYGIQTDPIGRVVALDLSGNGLEGEPLALLGELAGLTRLTSLRITDNALSGRLPESVTDLPLVTFDYSGTGLCAPAEAPFQAWLNAIPEHWGSGIRCAPLSPDRKTLVTLYEATDGPGWTDAENWLTYEPVREWHGVETDADGRVTAISLPGNRLSGPLPPGLGSLDRIERLELGGNALRGPIPSDLGSLSELQDLSLQGNQLAGALPAALAGASSLRRLFLTDNQDLSGALPESLTALRLEALRAEGTDLCAPKNPTFERWLERVRERRIEFCEGGGVPYAYLTQAVQSLEDPVPLVAGRPALLRVFVTAARRTSQGIPPVRARFFRHGSAVYVAEISGGTAPIPVEVTEGDLSLSANAEIPARVIRPGLEMVIEIDPEGTLGPGLGVAERVPASGRMSLDVLEIPDLDLTVIPFVWQGDGDVTVVDAVAGMASDPEGHELLWATRALLPFGALDVTAHPSVLTSSNTALALLDETLAIRALEGGRGHYMGTMARVAGETTGAAYQPGWISFVALKPLTIAHELGHNMNLGHAPCGGPSNLDPSFPNPGGATGAWGYDFRQGGGLRAPGFKDLMSYCVPQWISGYNFRRAMAYRQRYLVVFADAQSLLLWGGVDADGTPYLNPAFVVNAPPQLPESTGEYRVTGRGAAGEELFAVNFDLPVVADGDGGSSFSFVLPVEAGWAETLASVTLAGPGGSGVLGAGTNAPMTILRDRGTGEVRGILRDEVTPDSAGAPSPQQEQLEILFSRGIPEAAGWGR